MGPAGHFAVGFVAKHYAPKVPLWLLLLGSVALDILGFCLRLLGIENYDYNAFDSNLGTYVSVPQTKYWSHGLLMTFVWSALAALVAYLIWRDRRTSEVVSLTVFSHWVLDFIVHPPDLPLLLARKPAVGLGLWTSNTGMAVAILLEIILFASGVAFFVVKRKEAQVKTSR